MSAPGSTPRRRGPRLGIGALLLAVAGFALVLPIATGVALRIFDDQLIRRTEAQLIGQAVVVAEAWREAWLAEQGIAAAEAPDFAPPDLAADERYFPFEPRLQLDGGVLSPAPAPSRFRPQRDDDAARAGARVQPILERAVRMNLSAVRVLDTDGCVVASSGAELGACLGDLPEVASALAGGYGAVLRHRYSDEPPPGIESLSRRGRVRVYAAIPVRSGGDVIGVVRLSRTALDPAKALWFDRYRLAAALAGCAALIALLSFFVSRTIARPLRTLTEAAGAIARGEGPSPMRLPRLAPEELRSLSSALDGMIRQLSDRAEYIAEFATNLSHELKTPLTSIRGAAELLDQEWEAMKEDERRRFLANIEEDTERMERLVTRLLHLARIQAAPEQAEDIELGPFLQALAEAYGPAVRLVGTPARGRIRIPREHLESALRNLLDNGVRHGAGAPVELSAEPHGERWQLRVRDRGPGISEGNRHRVFQRFFTTERDRGGTGLGLAIARAVAETRGGQLTFETSGCGTTFELLL